MGKTGKIVPKRRFRAFQNNGNWESRKFCDITFPAGQKNKDNLTLESYSITSEKGFIPQDEKFENGGTMRDADKRMYYIVPPQSFAYNPARINIGSIGYQDLNKNVIVSSLYEVFKTTESVDDRFLWHWFKSSDSQNLILRLQEGGVRLYFYYDKLCMGSILLPSVREQQKIGQYLDNLDNLITLEQRKLEKTKALKAAYLSEMFPQEGECVPKRRFAGFTGDWEQRAFDSLVIRQSSISREMGLPRVEYEDILSGSGKLNKDIYQKESSKSGIPFSDGDVLFGKLRPYLSNWILADFCGIAVGDFWVFKALDINCRFIYCLIQAPAYQQVANQSTGTKMPRSDWNIVAKTNFRVPPNSIEQSKIGDFFSHLDNLITLQQRKLEKLQSIKQAYLNEMFI